MNRVINTIKSRRLKKLIRDKDYYLYRLDLMETRIHDWKFYYSKAKTNIEKTYCNKMINMYLKRLIYYIYK